MNKPKQLRRFRLADLPRQVLLSWLLAVLIEYLLLPASLRDLAGLGGLAAMSLPRVIAVTAIAVALLQILSRYVDTVKIERWSLVGAFALLSGVAILSSQSKPLVVACTLVGLVLVVFALKGWNSSPEPAPKPQTVHKAYVWITVGMTVLFFLFVCAWTLGRLFTFTSGTFDMGIFTQMFHSMAETGLPMTTVERDQLLSHFHVHMSPIFYLLLPFYWLVPRPETLQVLQAAVMASAVIPLWLLAKHHGLSGLQRTLVCGLLLLLPAFSGGANYDIHENCFLTPLLLWLLYGIDRKNIPTVAVSALLTLTVKEDAAVYVAVIALWLIVKTLLHFDKQKWQDLVTGIALLAVALGWFLAVTGYLSAVGQGVMSTRYKNFMYDGSKSLFTVIKAVIMNPLKAIYECADREKWEFIRQTMLPLLCIPFLTRRFERYILLIPYILINLMSDYQFQHSVLYQYSFGPIACLMYLVVVNLADWKLDVRRMIALITALIISASYFAQVNMAYYKLFTRLTLEKFDDYVQVQEALEVVPEDASVTASTFYTIHLAQRDELYDIVFASKEHVLNSDYIVLKPNAEYDYKYFVSDAHPDGFSHCKQILEENGFEVYYELDDLVLIYKKTA